MSVARTERLLNLLTLLLNSRRPIALREIRELEEFGAYRTDDPKSGERAFERDKAALLELGVPLRWVNPDQEEDEEGLGGYVIDRERYYLPDLHLTPGELALLSIAGAAAAAIPWFPGKAAVIRALAKLGFDVDKGGSAPTLAHTPLLLGVDPEQISAHLALLHDAMAKQSHVQLTYVAVSSRQVDAADQHALGVQALETQRQIDPYGLYYRKGSWYVVGYCHLRQAERTFHLGRISSVRLIGSPGAFALPESFDLKAHAERRPWEYPCGPIYEVTIRLAPRLAPAIPEIFGRHVQVMQTQEGPLVIVKVSHPDALIATVLPYGTAAEIMAPQHLRRQIGAIYAALANKYSHLSAVKKPASLTT